MASGIKLQPICKDSSLSKKMLIWPFSEFSQIRTIFVNGCSYSKNSQYNYKFFFFTISVKWDTLLGIFDQNRTPFLKIFDGKVSHLGSTSPYFSTHPLAFHPYIKLTLNFPPFISLFFSILFHKWFGKDWHFLPSPLLFLSVWHWQLRFWTLSPFAFLFFLPFQE